MPIWILIVLFFSYEKPPGTSLKSILLSKIVLMFTIWINCSSDRKNFANYRTCKSFSLWLEQFFLTVGQNNFGNKIPLPLNDWCILFTHQILDFTIHTTKEFIQQNEFFRNLTRQRKLNPIGRFHWYNFEKYFIYLQNLL